MADSPTLLQAATPLAWLRLHPKGQGCTHRNLIVDSREQNGCS